MDVQAFQDSLAWAPPFDGPPDHPDAGEHGLGLLTAVAECGGNVILLLDSDQRILRAFGPALRILGRNSLALPGTPLGQLAWHHEARSGSVSPALLCSHRPDGTLVLLEGRFRRLPAGPSGRTLCILRDVTDEVRMREQVGRLQALEPIGQLAAGIAHDFNNLLQTMMGSLELLLDQVGDRPEARESAEAALRMGERGGRLTHHLLAFMRRQVPRPRPLSLPPLVDEVAHTLRRTLGPRIAVITRIAPGLPAVHADPGQTEAALLNLALNARDAMPRGGSLTIEIASRAAPIDPLDAAGEPAEHVVLSVTDTGTGMSSDLLARACEPFFSTKGSEGTGLGLSMAQAFARQSGGDMRMSSNPGTGTRVEIRLPAAQQQGADVSEVASPGQRSGRLLLVDDEPEVLVTIGSFLQSAGFTVRTARGGEEALAALSSDQSFAAMVTDYAMPGLEGDEFIGHVRLMAPDLPILVVSGYGEAERLVDMTRHLRVLRKPFRRVALVREVAALMDEGRRV